MTDNIVDFRRAWVRREWAKISKTTAWPTAQELARLIFHPITEDTQMGCPICGHQHSNREGCQVDDSSPA